MSAHPSTPYCLDCSAPVEVIDTIALDERRYLILWAPGCRHLLSPRVPPYLHVVPTPGCGHVPAPCPDRCAGVTKEGWPCRLPAWRGGYCHWHDHHRPSGPAPAVAR